MRELQYNRIDAVEYARKWAFARNPQYLDFSNNGGDCTNFVSQCLYAGAKVMNPQPIFGWYYYSSTQRTASWTGVDFLYKFLINNDSVGAYAIEVNENMIELGDIVQLGDHDGNYYHSLVITAVKPKILVTAHTIDVYMRPLSSYTFAVPRFLHILGVRQW